MKVIIVGAAGLLLALAPCEAALAYFHANAYGGRTSHTYGSTSHANYYGGSTSHTYGEGTSHTNAYGGGTSHNYYGGTTHTNAYGGTTSGEYGYGGTHTNPYGYTTAYHPPTDYYGYHPPTAVPYYGSGCYDCDGSAWGAAAAGAVVGAAAASASASAQSSNAYAAGYNAGAASTYNMGQSVAVLPSGCSLSTVGGSSYYRCGSTWFSAAYGAGGVYYRVVPAP